MTTAKVVIKLKWIVAASGGIYTDIWVDGAYTRLPYQVNETAVEEIVRFRKRAGYTI